ncbi:MAG: hypothetical protein A2Z24_02430 [Candidatus Woykebacteria bacterium RBG_16_44_10]|uniref:Regulatory protein RecX n=2 Tax=Candidatus Woykeibacteriota TaxID=1817899 RepID=A0A1G1WL01_9BACT|nr:MAG: hypothetical protein A2Z24_02430 [Candidatus Woykebacteria bacterium RBG_16_44_10]OGY28402.1 MAG: hypothetical protein A2Z42_03955 [Candidatus Woykebacteria bacterium RBG_19FT_COMBO_43_10]
MKITNIEPQKKKSDRVNIFIDGQFAFGISMALRFENKLEVGQGISESKVKELIEKDQIERLVNKALRFLSYRPRSEKEIREHLLRKGGLVDIKSEEEKAQYNQSIEEVIKQLKKLDQIDDAAFAKWWVEQRLRFKPQALGLIKRELLVKGVDKDTIEETTHLRQGFGGQANEEDLAMRAASKKLVSYKKLEPKDFRIKMGQFLARKGFSWEIIKKTVDSLAGKRVE